jgi:hypothetical protein
LAGALSQTNEAALLEMVEHVLGDASFVARSMAIQRAAQELERAEPGASLVEGFLTQPETLRALKMGLQT